MNKETIKKLTDNISSELKLKYLLGTLCFMDLHWGEMDLCVADGKNGIYNYVEICQDGEYKIVARDTDGYDLSTVKLNSNELTDYLISSVQKEDLTFEVYQYGDILIEF